ncbi:MAG: L-seryl-tRNA(Sec) selenium transferase, partial [Desulfobacterota bacterium]|nr:L-seryl-tRNA(Sec) selenium transferase [Thermodesulfobacteriota bacterium]
MENQAKKNLLRSIPAVDELLNRPSIQELLEELPRKLVLNAIREEISAFRQQILSSDDKLPFDETIELKPLVDRIVIRAKNNARLNLRKVINATGIIIHTNLGRAPLLPEALERIREIAEGYSNLEYELEKGQRGSRYRHIEDIIKELSGGESALVVNNNAAAVLVVLNTLAKGYEVIVSRGELIEIGGSFRLPDIMAQSGCRLREVGATNKTKLSDYEQALSPEIRLILT